MPDILHRVGIDAEPKEVFETLTSLEGNRAWWDSEATGNAKKGGTLRFFKYVDMKVVEAKPGKLVSWKCVKGPEDWLGTEVRFELVWKKERTFVLFKHAGWKEPSEMMHHCSTKWAVFLLSLKYLLERGEGRPKPYDIKIDTKNN